ncbi:pyridoxamine 5'-phosphate oxidase family protein [Sphaerisporangium aureirubrum]|uniref:Pyridoxamine 5'-phosphate oxidase putative domain-containing protein n=1 Tax=Sphaerisporangium aureirubrum TaxID=1544736 RepID=A0ABW1NGG1_9ACTN
MAENEPVAEQSSPADEPSTTPRASARSPMNDAGTYWLSTLRPNGRPNIVPVLGVWLDGALHLAVSQAMHDPETLPAATDCVVTTDPRGLELVVRGRAARVLDDGKLGRLSGVFSSKYGIALTVQGGAFHGGGTRATGPSPYDVYEVTPAAPPAGGGSPSGTRWSF